jgi:hypothetical protein
VLALDGGEDKINGGLDRAWLASFAGLHFELAASARTNERLASAARPFAPGGAGAASCPSAVASRSVSPCRVLEGGRPAAPVMAAASPKLPAVASSEPLPAGAALRWSWRAGGDGVDPHAGEGEVLTRFGCASVAERSTGTVARVWLSEDPRAAHLVLSGLASLLLHRQGGAILHSASVALDDRVLAFVGPSGAGKSTACRHLAEAELFSVDRLAVLPVPSRASAPGASNPGVASAHAMWFAHPLPGGTRSEADLPSAPERWLPLAGVLRVQRPTPSSAAGSAHVRAISGAAAVATLRESAFQIGSEPSSEAELLAVLEALAFRVPVARLELSLGACLTPALRRWLVDQAKERT